jgi:PleD family two-component response regulator
MDVEALIRQADSNLLSAKASGRNRVCAALAQR